MVHWVLVLGAVIRARRVGAAYAPELSLLLRQSSSLVAAPTGTC